MANNVHYYIKAVAKDKSSLERLYKIMNYEDSDYCLYRVRGATAIDHDECFDCDGSDEEYLNWLDADMSEPVAVQDAIYEDEGDGYIQDDDYLAYFCLIIMGDVAWSASPWFNGEDKPEELADNGTAHLTSLNVIAKELGVGIELWGHEEFSTFQQHFIMNAKGKMAVAETKDWNGYSESEIEDMEREFKDMDEEEKKYCPLNDPDFDPDELGFGDDYCLFSSANKIYEAKAKRSRKKRVPAKKPAAKKKTAKKNTAKKTKSRKSRDEQGSRNSTVKRKSNR